MGTRAINQLDPPPSRPPPRLTTRQIQDDARRQYAYIATVPKRAVHLTEAPDVPSGDPILDSGPTLSERWAEASAGIAALGIKWPADSVAGDRRDAGER